MNYRVVWEIDIEAYCAEEAAQKALEIQRNPDSIATVFSVRDEDRNVFIIDAVEDQK